MKATDTLVWILYDIVENRPRAKVARACKEAGLFRVQKSVFLGSIARNRLDELVLQIEDLVVPESDSVYIFPLCKQDFNKVRCLGPGIDRALVSDEIQAFYI